MLLTNLIMVAKHCALAVSSVTLNEKDSPDPNREPGLFIILAELEGVGIEKQRACFVIPAEMLVLHGVMWGMKALLEHGASRQLSSRRCCFLQCLQTKLLKKLFGNSSQKY